MATEEAARRLQACGNIMVPLSDYNCEADLVPSVKYTHTQARDLEYQFIPDISKDDRLCQLAVLHAKRALITDDWRKIWFEDKLDLVLCPSAQTTAVIHDRFGLPADTTLANVLDVRAP
ncbi:uncharacterized protein BO97DRAFT_420273 [Aspergillus homomorphus CBS 101889]|uniref:Uncharacterized protein n=1 Tax=Aspergillus homomorphus (strain CBS 101889) TaxID=1450537 RepID=A0A395I9P6_ASPHC|nr:hypothetical protein BO97DRAFT_420273 [Aspergillus homomorphus CBS 101889]RAL16887.1 hypothetical protein BO97DRAFT_420273 [Aspergillus homomorphus CBS 101889]